MIPSMDSVSSRASPVKHKRDPPPWNNRHEDLKRAAFSSLDKDLRQWKNGHAIAKRELNIADGSVNFSRLDKARSSTGKESTQSYAANPENLNKERSSNSESRRPGSEGEKGVTERGKLQKFSSQKIYGGDSQADERKDLVPLSTSEEDVRSVRNSQSRNSGVVAPCRSSSLGTEKPHLSPKTPRDQSEPLRFGQGIGRSSSKYTLPHNNKTSVVPCRSDTERSGLKRTAGCANMPVNPGRKVTEKDSFTDKDCKRIIKLKAKISTDNGSTDVIRSSVKKEKIAVCTAKGIKNEEKLSVSSSKSFNGSSEEVSLKNYSPIKDQKSSSPSSEQISDRKVLETPIAFLHIARRARSERRRDDSSRSHSSKGVSLDGFGAELEEVLLRKQEAEVDSGAQCATEAGAATSSRSTDTLAEGVCHQQESHMQRLVGLQKSEAMQSLKGLEQTTEREEGELEPEEDEGTEKHSLEVGGNVKVDAGNDMKAEKNLDKHGEIVNWQLLDMCKDVNKHESGVLAIKVKSSGVSVSVANTISACTNSIDQGQELSRKCHAAGGNSHVCEVDSGHSNLQHEAGTPFSVMKENLANPFCGDTDMNLRSSNSALNEKGSTSLQQTSLPLSIQTSETIAKVSTNDDGLHAHELSKVCDNSGGKHLNGEYPPQLEIGAMKDSAGHVQEREERFAHDHKHKKLKTESLQLSLALPGCTISQAKSSSIAGHADSERSLTHLSRRTQHLSQFHTEAVSDGFTTSLSLSSFVHNPSCSLNITTIEDQELSCGGSRQILQGRVTLGGSLKESSDGKRSVSTLPRDTQKRKVEASLCPQILENSSAFLSHTKAIKNMGSNQAAQRNAFGTGAQASKSTGSMQQDRVQKLFNQAQQQSQPQPQPHIMAKTLCEPLSLAKNVTSERNKETLGEMQVSNGKVGPLEICSEPVAAMAQKLQELPDSFLEGLKGLVRELLGSFVKREEFLALQQILRSRMDLTEETLLRAHPTQLEILVALKTGMQSFVQQGAKTLTYKALIEIFFQTRCHNVDCQQSLPVDGCECKVCSQKKGFCHECMCMVCSKFDSDSNTSRWVGCDHCMHWCHTDCGLRMSHIKSTSVFQRTSEIQFRCLSCDHYMELYGFVKGVFENFAASWNAETLAKELDCVRRIFHSSEDGRGKQLRWKAEEMLQKLENNVTASDVCCCMLQFFAGKSSGVDLERADQVFPRKAHSEQPNQLLNHNAEEGKGDFAMMGSIVARKLSNLVEVYSNKELERRPMRAVEVHKEGAKEGVEQDLHNMIGEKLTDVLMYQARADAAREDATNLRHIILSKARRLEEDRSLKCARLRLEEVEGRRKRLFEELQALEKSQHDFETMKVQIQSDMKHLTVMSNLQLA